MRLLLAIAASGRLPDRDRLIILLAVYAGMRAAEIARLTWSMVLDANGEVGRVVEIRGAIAKRGASRRIPMHPKLRTALVAWRRLQPSRRAEPDAVVIRSQRGGALRPNSIVNWFIARCRAAGLEGCSSHSGRRAWSWCWRVSGENWNKS